HPHVEHPVRSQDTVDLIQNSLGIIHVLKRMEGCGKMKIVGVKGKPFAGAHKHTAFGASIAREIRVKIEPDHGMVAKTAAHENNFIPASTTHDKSGETVHVAQ